ncbi:MAG: protease modulator HflC [Betaproteobacteria bacterium]|nr:protease modulator HflC [Betaproteobacteria bacterium]
MKISIGIGLSVLVLLLLAAALSLFVVDQREYALVFQFGEIRQTIEKPGLYFKAPFIQNVKYLDKRILTIDTSLPERFITSEKKNVLVDSYIKWRIADPKLFYQSVAGDESRAEIRLLQTVNAGLREEFGRFTVHDVLSTKRDQIMNDMTERSEEDAKKIGVKIVDVRLKRIEYEAEVSDSVYQRMRAERTRVAAELRALGAAEAERIRADANRQREVILAEAYRKAQEVKGKGDAEAAAIYAQAFSRNPEFYEFYRSLEAYRESFKTKNDLMIVDPNSDFFKFLKNALGNKTVEIRNPGAAK